MWSDTFILKCALIFRACENKIYNFFLLQNIIVELGGTTNYFIEKDLPSKYRKSVICL